MRMVFNVFCKGFFSFEAPTTKSEVKGYVHLHSFLHNVPRSTGQSAARINCLR